MKKTNRDTKRKPLFMTNRSNGYGLGLKNAVQTTFHENAQLCTPPPNGPPGGTSSLYLELTTNQTPKTIANSRESILICNPQCFENDIFLPPNILNTLWKIVIMHPKVYMEI